MSSEIRHYELRTIADIFANIPKERIDAFLADLGNMMKSHQEVSKALSGLAQARITSDFRNGFTWIDDGRNDQQIMICKPVHPKYRVGDSKAGEEAPEID